MGIDRIRRSSAMLLVAWIALAVAAGAQAPADEPAPDAPAADRPAEPAAEPDGPLHELVRRGRERFDAGDWAGAQAAFAAAELKAPEDLRVAYDRGRTYHAAGDADNARSYYERVAGSGDVALAARALFNLGDLRVTSARGRLGDDPVALPKADREGVLADLASAIARYRGVLELRPDDEDARKNIETIRLWIVDMEERWRRADLEKAREQADLARYLQTLITRQIALRQATRYIDAGVDDAGKPVRFSEVAIGQADLRDEIPHVEKKVRAHIAAIGERLQGGGAAAPAPGAQPPAPQPLDPKVEEALQALEKQLLDGAGAAGTAMATAVNRLDTLELDAATTAQRNAVVELEKMWRSIAGLIPLLEGAIARQTTVAAATRLLAAGDEEAPRPDDLRTRLHEDSRDLQTRVHELLPLMESRAIAEADELRKTLESASSSGQAPTPGADPERDKKRLAALEYALERLPDAEAAMSRAKSELASDDVVAAGKAAEPAAEAEKILREIAEKFPKDEQQKPPENDPSENDPQPQDGEQPQPQDDKGKGEDKPETGAGDKDAPKKADERQLDREAARRALERMREARNKRDKQRRAVRGGRRPVERDW